MLYSVTIDPDLLGGQTPSDGFIDPTSVHYHRARLNYTGTAVGPTFTVGDIFLIRDIPITVSGTSLANLITDINNNSFKHNVFASANENKLQLTMLPNFEFLIPTMANIEGDVVSDAGFNTPTISAPQSLPSTLAISEAKERGNIRWELILQQLQLTGNINYRVTSISDATVEDAPDLIEFTLEVSDNYFNYGLTGDKVFGIVAIKEAIAKTLMYSVKKMRDFYDPTDTTPASDRPLSQVVRDIEVGPLTTSDSDALDSIEVTVIT